MQKHTLLAVFMLLCIAGTLFVSVVAAQTDTPTPTPDDGDPVFFVVGDGAIYSGGIGWYAGYVISGTNGTYTLQISANGPSNRFPITNTKVLVCISDEAKQTATVTIGTNATPSMIIKGYNASQPSYYGASGGVFAESDYYGYNDTYTIASLTYSQCHWPTNYYALQVKVAFNSNATSDSKVMFLCYGVDSKGDAAKTPFSGGTLIVSLPEYAYASVAVLACLAAYGVYRKKHIN